MVMSALPLKADVCVANRHVCFGPGPDIRWRDAPASIVKKLSSNAEPYGGEDQETANDVVHGGALTQKQNGKYHD